MRMYIAPTTSAGMPKPRSENSPTGWGGKLATLLVCALACSVGTAIPGTEAFVVSVVTGASCVACGLGVEAAVTTVGFAVAVTTVGFAVAFTTVGFAVATTVGFAVAFTTVGFAVATTVGFAVAVTTVGFAVATTVGFAVAFTTVDFAVAVTTVGFVVGVFATSFCVGVGVTLGAGVAVGLMVGVAVVHASLSVFQLPPLLKSTIELYCRYTKKPPLSQAVLTDAMLFPSEAVFPRFAPPTASLYHDPVPLSAPPVSSQWV